MSDRIATRPWEWRKAAGGVFITLDHPGPRKFHAYDANDNAACKPLWGLMASTEEPNEGSDLCAACIEVMTDEPGGRPARWGRHQ